MGHDHGEKGSPAHSLIAKPVPARYFINRSHGAYEMNFGTLGDIPADGRVPNDRFYVNSRAKPPQIQLDQWRLEVVGDAVKKPRSFTLDELIGLGTEARDYIMDCGTNGRGFFPPYPPQGWPLPAGFPPWGWGAMGAARWTGVPLERLLRAVEAEDDEHSWIAARSLDAVRQGQNVVRPFEHALQTIDALERGTLLVFQMNDETLPVDHGFPLRFFVPGFGANTAVKWLGRLSITKQQPELSPTQKNEVFKGPDYPLDGVAPSLQNVKSCLELFGPRATMVLPPKQPPLTIYGRAWSAPSRITKVEVKIQRETVPGNWETLPWPGSTHDGWWPANIINTPRYHWWVRFSFGWTNPDPGSYRLASRAYDANANVQPPGEGYPWNQHCLHWNGWVWQSLILLPLTNMP